MLFRSPIAAKQLEEIGCCAVMPLASLIGSGMGILNPWNLQIIIDNANKSDEERYVARLELQKLPRNANPTRLRNRCALTGRPRGTFRTFGLARNKIRELAFKGDIPGVTKASW